MFYTYFSICSAIAFYLQYQQYSRDKSNPVMTGKNVGKYKRWLSIQNSYLRVYFLMVSADWLQGPFEYDVYSQMGYDHFYISLFFIVGFLSSGTLGTYFGSLADTIGRKQMAMVYSTLYALSCITKVGLTSNIWFIFIGRVAGGIATSLLYSVFESWISAQAQSIDAPSSWLSSTLSLATLFNGIAAVLTGIYSSTMMTFFPGPRALSIPFVSAIILLTFGGLMLAVSWTENFGSSTGSVFGGMSKGLSAISKSPSLQSIGIIQTFFETCMFTWIVNWVPTLRSAFPGIEVPLGLVFSTFMLCFMIGSRLFGVFLGYYTKSLNHFFALRKTLRSQLILGSLSFLLSFLATLPIFEISVNEQVHSSDSDASPFEDKPSQSNDSVASIEMLLFIKQILLLFAFGLFEISCGMYWPSLGSVRAVLVPSDVRSAVMNLLRIPLNVCVALMLYGSSSLPIYFIYAVATIALGLSSYLSSSLENRQTHDPN